MPNILLRSPYYIYETQAGASYATLELSIGGTLRYTISKDVDSSEGALFEISELARDYLDISFSGSYSSQVAAITGEVTFYDDSDVQVGLTINISHKGFDGYGKFLDGASPTIGSGRLLQSNTTVYYPENTSGRVAVESLGAVSYVSFSASATSVTAGSHTVYIERVCEPKYTPVKLVFVNKFGVLQDLYFFKKSVENVSSQKESYKRSLINSTGVYSTSSHSKRILTNQGKTSQVLNSGYLSEAMNEVFEELLLSEQVWATINTDIIPVDVTTNQLTYKTSVNDRLVDYTINIEYAFDLINDLR